MVTIPLADVAVGAWASPEGFGVCHPRRILHFDRKGHQKDWDGLPSRHPEGCPFYPAGVSGREVYFWSETPEGLAGHTKSGGPWQLLAGDRPPVGPYRLVGRQFQGEAASFTLDRGALKKAALIEGELAPGLILNPWTGPRAEGPEGVLELKDGALVFTPAPPLPIPTDAPPGHRFTGVHKDVVLARGHGVEIRVRALELASKRWLVRHSTEEGPFVMTATLRQVDRKDPGDNSTQHYPPGEWIPALARWDFPQPLALNDWRAEFHEGEDLGGDLACATGLTWTFDPVARTGHWEAFLDFC